MKRLLQKTPGAICAILLLAVLMATGCNNSNGRRGTGIEANPLTGLYKDRLAAQEASRERDYERQQERIDERRQPPPIYADQNGLTMDQCEAEVFSQVCDENEDCYCEPDDQYCAQCLALATNVDVNGRNFPISAYDFRGVSKNALYDPIYGCGGRTTCVNQNMGRDVMEGGRYNAYFLRGYPQQGHPFVRPGYERFNMGNCGPQTTACASPQNREMFIKGSCVVSGTHDIDYHMNQGNPQQALAIWYRIDPIVQEIGTPEMKQESTKMGAMIVESLKGAGRNIGLGFATAFVSVIQGIGDLAGGIGYRVGERVNGAMGSVVGGVSRRGYNLANQAHGLRQYGDIRNGQSCRQTPVATQRQCLHPVCSQLPRC